MVMLELAEVSRIMNVTQCVISRLAKRDRLSKYSRYKLMTNANPSKIHSLSWRSTSGSDCKTSYYYGCMTRQLCSVLVVTIGITVTRQIIPGDLEKLIHVPSDKKAQGGPPPLSVPIWIQCMLKSIHCIQVKQFHKLSFGGYWCFQYRVNVNS